MIWLQIAMSGVQNIPILRLVALVALALTGEIVTTAAVALRLPVVAMRTSASTFIPFAHFCI